MSNLNIYIEKCEFKYENYYIFKINKIIFEKNILKDIEDIYIFN